MSLARACFAVVAAAVVLVVSRPASPGCDSPGSSDGYDQCQKYPGCQCVSEVIPCAHGTWYTQYYVDPGKCYGSGPRPPAPQGSGSGSGKHPPPTACDRIKEMLDDYQKILAAYEDNDLLGLGIAQGWGPGLYNQMIWRSTHPGDLPPPGGGALMWTDPQTCEIHNYGPACKWLIDHHAPRQACAIALAHEQVHAQQCKHKDASFDPKDLQQYRDREVEAYQQTLRALEKYLHDHCP
jgi:hypothetical protein